MGLIKMYNSLLHDLNYSAEKKYYDYCFQIESLILGVLNIHTIVLELT